MLGYFMRTVCTVLILLFCAASVEAQFLQQCGETPYSIVMHITGVKNDKGSLTIALYDDDPERFLKAGEKIGHLRVPATTLLPCTMTKMGMERSHDYGSAFPPKVLASQTTPLYSLPLRNIQKLSCLLRKGKWL